MEDNVQNVETVVENQTQTAAPVVEKQTPQEINMSMMRKKLEAEEKARKDLENRLAQAERVARELKEKDEEVYVDPDKKRFEEQEKRLAQLEMEALEQKLPGFKDAMSDDNLASFQKLYPDEYNSLLHNPNTQSRLRAAYNMMDKYGFVKKDSPKVDMQKVNNDRIDQNLKKPSLASAAAPQSSVSPLGKMDEYSRRILTDEEKDKIMKDVARRKRLS